jgi:hypothetical protein
MTLHMMIVCATMVTFQMTVLMNKEINDDMEDEGVHLLAKTLATFSCRLVVAYCHG